MSQKQLISLTQEENNKPIFEYIDKKFDELKKFYQPKEPPVWLSRRDVADKLSVDISTVHNMTVKGILQKYQCGSIIRYKLAEVESSIIKLNN